MRALCIDAFGGDGMLDFCLRCQEAGHKVRWYFNRTEKTKYYGKGLVEIVNDWRDWARWADLVILSDNTKYLREVDAWRQSRGLRVVGATQEAAEWELNRTFGMAVLKKAGIAVPPYKEFSDYDSAIAYVKRENRRFVSKPIGDEPDKALSYVSKSAADLIYMLDRWKKAQKLKGAFMLQEFIGGCEMAVGGFFGPHGFNEGWCENWEFKQLMAGDRGPNCFTPDAEVLTRAGWKSWPDVTMQDELCTLKDGQIEYEAPSQIVVGDFEGRLCGWVSPQVDILVTPGHQMYVQDDHYRRPFFFEDAADTFEKRRTIMRSGGTWSGDKLVSNDEAFAALIGIHIADGYCKKRSLQFGNCPFHKQKIFIEIARRAGYEAKMYGKDLYINSRYLSEYCSQFGLAHEKFVPQWIKDSHVSVIRAFLYGYGAGDGASRHGNLIYTTVSRRLADDLQELTLKVGWAASIRERDRRNESHEINGYLCVNRRIAYDIGVSQQNTKTELSADNRYRCWYKGKVHCATVSSHVIYVRRNGKACWIGQTGEMGTTLRFVSRSKLADRVLKPLIPQLEKLGYVGYIDVNCIIDENGDPWPLEFTMRMGWPTFNIQSALLKGDPLEWLADLSAGRDSRPFRLNEISVGVVLALPDFPYSHATRKEVVGVPIYGLTSSTLTQIHPCQVMQGEGPQEINGKILTAPMWVSAGDYVLVATETADTIHHARTKVYNVLHKIGLPSSPFYRPDIGVRLKKQLPLIQAKGYASGLTF